MDNERAEIWRKIINVPELNNYTIDTLRKRMFICSRHFRPEDYKNIESRSLNKTALPSLHLNLDEDEDYVSVANNTIALRIDQVMNESCSTITIDNTELNSFETTTINPMKRQYNSDLVLISPSSETSNAEIIKMTNLANHLSPILVGNKQKYRVINIKPKTIFKELPEIQPSQVNPETTPEVVKQKENLLTLLPITSENNLLQFHSGQIILQASDISTNTTTTGSYDQNQHHFILAADGSSYSDDTYLAETKMQIANRSIAEEPCYDEFMISKCF